MVTQRHVHANEALKTPQFWLIWAVLCLNVSAGIGVLGMASPLLQEVFGGKLLGVTTSFMDLTAAQKGQIAAIAAGFTGLLSLFNIGGRFFWASLSDRLGRKMTYAVFFVLGFVLYASIPWTSHTGNIALFALAFCVILSMYGGGFATVPAYLADMFGTQMVGAIHGRLLTAWSTAGILGPVLVNYLREYQIAHGVERAAVYDITMIILAGLLILGFICNLLVRPVNAKHFMTEAQLDEQRHAAATKSPTPSVAAPETSLEWQAHPGSAVAVVLAWAAVGLPLGWGIWITLQKAAVLFS